LRAATGASAPVARFQRERRKKEKIMQRMIWRLAAATAATAIAFVLGAICAWTLANHSGAHAAVDGRMALAAQQSASPTNCVPGVSAPVNGRTGSAMTGSNRGVTAQASSSAGRTSAHAARQSNGAGTNAHGRLGGHASGNASTENGGSETITVPTGLLLDGLQSVGHSVDGSAQSDGSATTGPEGATVAVDSRGASTPGIAVDASAQSDGSATTSPTGASVALDNGQAGASSLSLVTTSEPDTVTAPGQVGASTGTTSAPNVSTAVSSELPSSGLTASATAS